MWKTAVLVGACVVLTATDVTRSMPSLNIFIWGFLMGVLSVAAVAGLIVLKLVRKSSPQQNPPRPTPLVEGDGHQQQNQRPPSFLLRTEESCMWLNAVVVHAIRGFDQAKLNTILRSATQSNPFLQNVQVVTFSLGSTMPRILETVAVGTTANSVMFEARFNVESDAVVDIAAEAVVNWPVKAMCTLPVQVAVTNISIKGILRVKPLAGATAYRISFVRVPKVDFSLTVKYGVDNHIDRSKIGSVLRSVAMQWVQQSLVAPNAFDCDFAAKSFTKSVWE